MQSDYSCDRIITHNDFKYPIRIEQISDAYLTVPGSLWGAVISKEFWGTFLRAVTGQSKCLSMSIALLCVAVQMVVLQSVDYRLGFSNVSLPRFQFSYKQHSTYRNLFSMTELGCKFTCHSENPKGWQTCHWSTVRHKIRYTILTHNDSIHWAIYCWTSYDFILRSDNIVMSWVK